MNRKAHNFIFHAFINPVPAITQVKMNTIKSRLDALRTEMKKHNVDAWYISGTDPHASEYLPAHWQTRKFISGFTGSYGMVAITNNKAALWTDSRYFIQAAEQLNGTGIEMQKLRVPNAIQPENWLGANLPPGSRVGVDVQTLSVSDYRKFRKVLKEKRIELVETPDLLQPIWENRPAIPQNLIFELELDYAGFSRKEKQARVAEKLHEKKADLHVVTMLDELAWLYNLRGSDIDYNPVFTGFGLIGDKESHLFVDSAKIPNELVLKLEEEGIVRHDYNGFYAFLSALKNKKVFVDATTANYSVLKALESNNEIVEGTSLIAHLKARKNSTELNGFKEAMKKDGAALVEFLFWLKSKVGSKEITEFSAGRKLAELRSKQSHFEGESFAPIVGYKHHGAIVHLSVGSDDALPLAPNGILLFDSGGQYLNGTTDITRTVALGEVTDQQKRDFTLVLKGMIALTSAKFPVGTKGCHLDILARQFLWKNEMNYGHGTGHGVGHFLNVHEGPMAIRQEYNENPIEPGMVMSNEPGFYREGEYGIRTENMMVCVEREKTEFGQFLGFDTLTLCPIDTTLLEMDLLTAEEKEWLNAYHKKVKDEIGPLLKHQLKAFLAELTLEI